MKYSITLSYQGNQYSFLDEFEYEGVGDCWNADDQVLWMYTEGNYACDCNRSRFLAVYCDVTFDEREFDLPCGNTITLVSIREGERVLFENKEKEGTRE